MKRLVIPKIEFTSNKDVFVVITDLRTLVYGEQLQADLITNDELEKYNRLVRLEDKNMFITGRSIVRQVLQDYLNIPASSINFDFNMGKPSLRNPNGGLMHFNVTHSHNIVMVAFNKEHEIGIDIEFKHAFDNLTVMAKTVMSDQELNIFCGLTGPDKINYFYRCWTIKESLLKCMGVGLQQEAKKINTEKLSLNQGIQSIEINHHDYCVFNEDFDREHCWALSLETMLNDFVIVKKFVDLD